jgi:2-oxoglutarate dehydrogenase E2 component (dihydrolipoamide succinyltransferase)
MSFLQKAVTRVLQIISRRVNSMMDGDHKIAFDFLRYFNCSIRTKRINVPVVRNAENLTRGAEADIKKISNQSA